MGRWRVQERHLTPGSLHTCNIKGKMKTGCSFQSLVEASIRAGPISTNPEQTSVQAFPLQKQEDTTLRLRRGEGRIEMGFCRSELPTRQLCLCKPELNACP